MLLTHTYSRGNISRVERGGALPGGTRWGLVVYLSPTAENNVFHCHSRLRPDSTADAWEVGINLVATIDSSLLGIRIPFTHTLRGPSCSVPLTTDKYDSCSPEHLRVCISGHSSASNALLTGGRNC